MVPLSFGCGSAVFAAIATLAPSRAARNAIASPMPRLPPDTNIVLPLSDVMKRLLLWTHGRMAPSPTRREGTTEIASPFSVQYPAAGFRQRECRDEEYAVGRYRKNRDGVAERRRGRERTDQKRKQRADAAAEIVAKALARTA